MADPKAFHECPDVIPAAPPRKMKDMFRCAMSYNFDNSQDRVIRLHRHGFFKEPLQTHPFYDPASKIYFNPYALPRCIDHDFSEGIVEYLINNIFKQYFGRNETERARTCGHLCQNLNWFPGCSKKIIGKITTVR